MKRRILPLDVQTVGQAIEVFVHQKLEMTLESVERAMLHGALYLNGKRITRSRPLPAQGTVMLVLEEKGRSSQARPRNTPKVRVLYEDAWIIATDKPAGCPTQPTLGRVGESWVDAVSMYCQHPVSTVHRLDLETSGVLIFGKMAQTTAALAAQFKNRLVQKKYLAVTTATVPLAGTIEAPLSRDSRRPGNFKVASQGQGIDARTKYHRLVLHDDFCVVALYPHTGRTHQLRVHLASIGAPIAGDRRYGGSVRIQERAIGRCLLHAQSLRIQHPGDGREISFDAPLPEDMQRFCQGNV